VPEGDSIFRTARALHRYLAGRTVTRFESVLPALIRVDHDRPVAGRIVEQVVSRGKHILMTFSGDLVLHTHMRMNGSWHGYAPGAPWRRPARDMRVLIETAHFVAVGFNVPVAEFLTTREITRHAGLRSLGPDLLNPSFDIAEAVRRLRAQPRTPIAEALLDQRVASGIGNIFKSETLFLAGLHPFMPAGQLADADVVRLLAIARDALQANVVARGRLTRSRGIRTRDSLDPGAGLWVYGRGGKPCRKCGAPIQSNKTGPDARVTYWCPRCQPNT
jgi:endonuclease-8